MSESPTQKRVALIVQNRTDDPRLLTLAPGTTVAQALEEAGLPADYSINHPESAHVLGQNEDLFELCDDGEKLKVTPPFVAGAWWNPRTWRRPAPPSTPVPIPPVVATSPTDARWLRRHGWKPEGNSWRGYFRVAGQPPLAGYIDLDGMVPVACFENPPQAVRSHVCVRRVLNTNSWYRVHEHHAVPGRTLRGFVTSVECWMQKVLKSPAPRIRPAAPTLTPVRMAVSQRGGLQLTNDRGDW